MIENQTNQEGNWTEADLMKLKTFVNQLEHSEKIILIFIAVFTILGNTLVLVATWRERSLHQPNKYFIACLAVADLLVGLFLAPIKAYKLDLRVRQRTMSIHLCRFVVWIDTFALTTSIYTLTFISFDRYLKISKPLQYMTRMTTSTSLKLIFIIVFISSCIASYAATPRSGSIGILFSGASSCSEADFDQTKSFYTFMIIGMFFVPTGVIAVMYVLIFLVAHKRQKMRRNGELGQTRSQRTALYEDLKVIKMLMIVVGVFIICWGPNIIWVILHYHFPNLLYTNSRSIHHNYRMFTIRMVFSILPLFNSLCNPIIYAFLDRKYKEAFKHLFRRCIHRPISIRPQAPNSIELPRSRNPGPR
ncbi:trace amine-associated receptor 5-like [Dendronephthya gigantea]|uniref:trace amine-associated receptor 5-like n=1 Tax=Dendronephthya gigantea TaxID=151771 RepID=UPI00106D1CA9|nr:trace amine-associated receptor 5-like [Dendronephthya gigantea]